MNSYKLIYSQGDSAVVNTEMNYDEIKKYINDNQDKISIIFKGTTIYPKNIKEIEKL